MTNDEIELNNLYKFLAENIYKIEKIVNNLIKNNKIIKKNNKEKNKKIKIKKK